MIDYDDDSLTNFKFKTDDNLVYDKKINVPICMLSICSVIKKGNSTYYQKNRDIILKRAKDYYYNNIEAIIKMFQKKREKK